MCDGADLVDDGQRVRPHRRLSGLDEIPARRGVLRQALDLIAPGGGGERELEGRATGRHWRLDTRRP